jgi:hypothetical protein
VGSGRLPDFRSEPPEGEHWNLAAQDLLRDLASQNHLLFREKISAFVSDRAEILEVAFW